jgi:hypothetical protein
MRGRALTPDRCLFSDVCPCQSAWTAKNNVLSLLNHGSGCAYSIQALPKQPFLLLRSLGAVTKSPALPFNLLCCCPTRPSPARPFDRRGGQSCCRLLQAACSQPGAATTALQYCHTTGAACRTDSSAVSRMQQALCVPYHSESKVHISTGVGGLLIAKHTLQIPAAWGDVSQGPARVSATLQQSNHGDVACG